MQATRTPQLLGRTGPLLGLATLAALGLAAALPASAQAQGYDFTLISYNATNTSAAPPSLGPTGQVAYEPSYSPGVIDVSDGTQVTEAVTGSGTPSFNSAGLLAYYAQRSSSFSSPAGSGIFSYDGTTVRTLAYAPDDGSGAYVTLGDAPSINAAGQAAFIATTTPGSRPANIYVTDGKTTSYIDGVDGPYTSLGSPQLNDAGQLVYAITRGSAAYADTHITVANVGGPVTDVLTAGQKIGHGSSVSFRNFGAPAENNAGTLAITGLLNDGYAGLFTRTGDGTLTRLDTPQSFTNFNGVAINDSGAVAYAGSLSGGGGGLFVSQGGTTTRILGTGDALLGSTVRGVGFSREGFNGAGQAAFYVTLTDGETAFMRATPAPEPSALAGLGLGLLGLSGLVLKARKRQAA